MVCTCGAGLRLDLGQHLRRRLPGDLHLLHRRGQRDHDLRLRVLARLLQLGRGVRDRADLHVQQPGDDQDEPDAAQAQHGVLLVQAAHRVEQLAVLLGGLVARQRHLDRQVGEVGQELVQRRVDQPDGHRQAVHRVEDLHEVAALQRLERVQRGLPARLVLGQDEPLDELAALAEEHVLGADQADPAGAEPAGPRAVLAGVRVGVHPEAAPLVGVPHDPVNRLDQVVRVRAEPVLEVLHDGRVGDRDLAEVDGAAGAVDGDHVALADGHAAGRGEPPGPGVHLEFVGAADAGLAHAAGHHGGVAGLAAAAGQDAPGGDHPVQVVRVGLAADQDDRLARGGPLDGRRGVEHRLADRGARRGADRGGDLLRLLAEVEPGEHQLGELVAGDPGDRLVHVDEALVHELGGDPERGARRCACPPGSAASRACRARW